MRNNDLKSLKSRLMTIKNSNESIYLKLNDCIYKTIGAGQIEEVDRIPGGAKTELIDCNKDHFVYLFTANGKPYYTEIISVSEAIENGKLPNKGWLDENDI